MSDIYMRDLMSPKGELRSPPLACSSIKEDHSMGPRDPNRDEQPGSNSWAVKAFNSAEAACLFHVRDEDLRDVNSPLLRLLIDAEGAANSAAKQLVSFEDALEEELDDSDYDKRRITRQKGLMLEKLDNFRRVNKSVRQRLKQLQDIEVSQLNAKQQIDILQNKISQAEIENAKLKQNLSKTELKIDDLMNLRREEQESRKNAIQMSKSADATRAHLQGQLRNKEAENSRLTVQLRSLEKTVMEQKKEMEELKTSITTLTEKAAQDKDALKKATRAQKHRAGRFEAAIEKCYAQLKEKEDLLAQATAERDSRKRQKEQTTDEKNKLVAQIDSLQSQIVDLTSKIEKEKEESTAANETVQQKVDKLIAENGELAVNNAALKSSVARLEQLLAECDSALVEEKIVCQEKKQQAEQYQYRVVELQAEVENLQMRHTNLLIESEKQIEAKNANLEKVRQEAEERLEKLKAYPELLSAAEQNLLECQENLQRSARKCAEKSECITELQAKVESQAKQLRSSTEMNESINQANLELKEKVNSLLQKMDELQYEKHGLVQELTAQEAALSHSNRQRDQQSSECQALNRQLEVALQDVRQQVSKVKDQAACKEETLQTKILHLEAEVTKRDSELKLLLQGKQTAEKQFQIRLRDLQLSLDQSESHKRSIQNYIDFLKNTYKAMFDEGLHTSTFGSSYFPK